MTAPQLVTSARHVFPTCEACGWELTPDLVSRGVVGHVCESGRFYALKVRRPDHSALAVVGDCGCHLCGPRVELAR